VRTHTQGLELFGRYRLNRNLNTQVSLTSLSATQFNGQQTTPSPFDIRYFIRGHAEYKFAGTWTASLIFLFREGSFYQPVEHAFFNSPLQVYQPVYGAPARLPGYNLLDFSLSKLFAIGEKASAVAFCALSNIPNFKNVRGYTYNFDYSEKQAELFTLRTLFFGMVLNF